MSALTATPTVDPQRCPLCGSDNQCGVQAARDAQAATGDGGVLCWCMTVSVPEALRERLPTQARGRSCICPGCVAAAHREAASAPQP